MSLLKIEISMLKTETDLLKIEIIFSKIETSTVHETREKESQVIVSPVTFLPKLEDPAPTKAGHPHHYIPLRFIKPSYMPDILSM
jgi:hypothetical protein